MLAQLTAAVINFSMRSPMKPVKPTDFMLHPPAEVASKQVPTRMTQKKRRMLADQLRAAFAAGVFGEIAKTDA